jgi:hypothetical protein
MRRKYEQHILHGFSLLDGVIPNWRQRCGRKVIRMDDSKYCLLGRLYGDYARGLDSLFYIEPYTANYAYKLQKLAARYGFSIDPDTPPHQQAREFHTLTGEVRLLLRRTKA